ncbi:hypothetical protein TROLL_86 [Bacillus phage Troll]|uniref:Uncharacterized protein n=6 Tax=Caudoviricetes TaxID=2731619 RepID=S5Z864_9CAUD|nr:hypothetical protein TROLL_86 [Bacillus phage Troll]AGT13656.1 hypothetical protein TROLL_86 [Bacillus phage Troll]
MYTKSKGGDNMKRQELVRERYEVIDKLKNKELTQKEENSLRLKKYYLEQELIYRNNPRFT